MPSRYRRLQAALILSLYLPHGLAHALEQAHYLLVSLIAILRRNEALQRDSMRTQDQGSLVLTERVQTARFCGCERIGVHMRSR